MTMLVLAGAYILGFVGIFIATLMEVWSVGPGAYAFGEALGRAVIWPVEIVRLFL
jgi:hypothetical protein